MSYFFLYTYNIYKYIYHIVLGKYRPKILTAIFDQSTDLNMQLILDANSEIGAQLFDREQSLIGYIFYQRYCELPFNVDTIGLNDF